MSTESAESLPLASLISGSSTDNVSVLTVVVVPLTVKFPPTVKLSEMLTSPSATSREFAPFVPVITSFSSEASQRKLSPDVAEWNVTSAPEPSEPTVRAPLVVKDVRVPTLVNEDPTTVALREVPVNVVAAAVTVIFAVPSKEVPFIVLAVARAVAVAAFPVISLSKCATVPVAFWNVIVLSAVGSVIAKVVS